MSDLLTLWNVVIKMSMEKKPKKIITNPERGSRGDFERLTITMHPEMVGALEAVRRQRKNAKEKNTEISSLIREAVAFWLSNREQQD
jgi:hypothetical protein